MKVQWTEQLVAVQQQKTEAIKKETEKIRAIADAEKNKAVLEIKIAEKLIEKEGERNISEINNLILTARERTVVDVKKYKTMTEAEANTRLLTKEYVQLETAKHLANNTKLYFSGDQSMLGGLLARIFPN